MLTLELKDLKFNVCHGLYPLEQSVPQDFVVDLRLELASSGPALTLDQTADYVEVYALVKACMNQYEGLIENLACRINGEILARCPAVLASHCRITKWPLLGGPGYVVIEHSAHKQF